MMKYVNDYHFLQDNNIQTVEELDDSLKNTEIQINQYEEERQKIRNKIRRAKPEEKKLLKENAKTVTAKITPLRIQQKRLQRIEYEFDNIQKLFETELRLEKEIEKNLSKGR